MNNQTTILQSLLNILRIQRTNILSKFILYTVTSLAVVRITITVFFTIFSSSELAKTIVNDTLHHYQYGIGIATLGFLLRKVVNKYYLLIVSIGAALIIDEHILLLKSVGISFPYSYMSVQDHTNIIFVIAFGFLLTMKFSKKKH